MDCNGVGGQYEEKNEGAWNTPGWENNEHDQEWPDLQAFGKGKGKGYGKGKGHEGKGKGKGMQYTPFFGNCDNCGLYGHVQARCPELGKGFKGNCNRCNIKGHSKGNCPILRENERMGKGGSKGGGKGYSKGKGKGIAAIEDAGAEYSHYNVINGHGTDNAVECGGLTMCGMVEQCNKESGGKKCSNQKCEE
jgi:hypothetical protein